MDEPLETEKDQKKEKKGGKKETTVLPQNTSYRQTNRKRGKEYLELGRRGLGDQEIINVSASLGRHVEVEEKVKAGTKTVYCLYTAQKGRGRHAKSRGHSLWP